MSGPIFDKDFDGKFDVMKPKTKWVIGVMCLYEDMFSLNEKW